MPLMQQAQGHFQVTLPLLEQAQRRYQAMPLLQQVQLLLAGKAQGPYQAASLLQKSQQLLANKPPVLCKAMLLAAQDQRVLVDNHHQLSVDSHQALNCTAQFQQRLPLDRDQGLCPAALLGLLHTGHLHLARQPRVGCPPLGLPVLLPVHRGRLPLVLPSPAPLGKV